MNFTEEYAKRKEEAEAIIATFTRSLPYPQPLRDAVTYSLTTGGKRLRPILLLEAVRMFGGTVDEAAADFALAIECIHTYSLIHDDLPCMDNDDFRRGQPTCHKKFGEANAVLAGDALLNAAFESIFAAIRLGGCREKYVLAGSCLAEAAGGNGMVGGQVADLLPSVSSEQIDYIYEKKTGALIRAALRAGALIGGATPTESEQIDKFGALFGFCFQLRDDLLDRDSEDEDKKTFLKVHGEEVTRRVLREKTEEALSLLPHGGFLSELTTNFMTRKE